MKQALRSHADSSTMGQPSPHQGLFSSYDSPSRAVLETTHAQLLEYFQIIIFYFGET